MKIQVTCCDCLKGMKKLKNESVDMIISSPPYNRSIGGSWKLYQSYDDNLSIDEYLDWSLNLFKEFNRILKKDGVVCWNFNYSMYTVDLPYRLILKLQESGLKLYDTICWNKGTGVLHPTSRCLSRLWEFVWVFAKQDEYYINKRDKSIYKYFQGNFPTNLLNITIRTDGQYRNEIHHTATFPVKLPEVLIKLYTKEEATILDPFMGSGTTARACQNINRNCIGFDIESDYVEYTKKSLNQKNLLNDQVVLVIDEERENKIKELLTKYDGMIDRQGAIKMLEEKK